MVIKINLRKESETFKIIIVFHKKLIQNMLLFVSDSYSRDAIKKITNKKKKCNIYELNNYQEQLGTV